MIWRSGRHKNKTYYAPPFTKYYYYKMKSFILFSILLLLGCWTALGSLAPCHDCGLTIFDPELASAGKRPNIAVPMRSMVISASIVDAIAEVTMLQEFETPAKTANGKNRTYVYQLPLFEQAAVTKFEARIGTRVIQGKVFERQDARNKFEEAIKEGKPAFLAEQETADVFSITVGNLPSSQIVRITVVYLTPLETAGATGVRFRLPTDVAPKYTPAGSTSLPGGQNFLYEGVLIKLKTRMSLPLVKVESATHSISTSGLLVDGMASVLVTATDPLDRDLVVAFTMEESAEPQIYVEESDLYNTMAMMLSIVPNIEDFANLGTAPAQEFIFMVDRSGSMTDKMVQVRMGLRQIIELLPEGSLFNFIGYGSSYTPLFSESQSVNTHLQKGLDYADSMEADFGGTEILSAIKFVLSLPVNSDYQRKIFLLTDGQVSNTQDVINYVSAYIGDSIMFTIGIGAHASTELVNGVARAGKGSAEFIDGESAQAVTTAVQAQMEIALTPALSRVTLDWGMASDAGDSQQSPFILPLLATSKRFLMFFISSERKPPGSVSLSATVWGTTKKVKFVVSRSSMVFLQDDSSSTNNSTLLETDSLIHKMAARSLIRDLEEGRSKWHAQSKSTEEIRDEIVRLGLLYQLASSETSFLAIDKEEDKAIVDLVNELDTTGDDHSTGAPNQNSPGSGVSRANGNHSGSTYHGWASMIVWILSLLAVLVIM